MKILAIPTALALAAPAAPAQTTQLVSSLPDGAPSQGSTQEAVVSGNGRFVAFVSTADDLVAGDTNDLQDVFVKDLATGAVERVSTDARNEARFGSSRSPSISYDGRYVAFMSSDDALLPGDTNGARDIFRKDRLTGAIIRVSVPSFTGQANDHSEAPSMSDNGLYVAFESDATNLGGSPTVGSQIYLRNIWQNTTVLVSRRSDGLAGTESPTTPRSRRTASTSPSAASPPTWCPATSTTRPTYSSTRAHRRRSTS